MPLPAIKNSGVSALVDHVLVLDRDTEEHKSTSESTEMNSAAVSFLKREIAPPEKAVSTLLLACISGGCKKAHMHLNNCLNSSVSSVFPPLASALLLLLLLLEQTELPFDSSPRPMWPCSF